MVTLQQNHNIDSPNGDALDHSMCEVMCNFDDTFETEEIFTNPWQASMNLDEEDEFSEETQEPFNDKE